MTLSSGEDPVNIQKARAGCAFAMLAFNTVVIGFTAASFAQGPYSSFEQELWYRYGSLAFFIVGCLFPAVMLFAFRRPLWILAGSVGLMLVSLLMFFGYAIMSGGGV